jgi:hypothetical protein
VAALTRFEALPGPATAINLGTGAGTTVRELLGAFNRVADHRIEAREAQRRPGDTVGAYTRIGRAERLLGWRPRYDVADGIAHSLQWAAIRDQILPAEPDPRPPPVRAPGRRRLGSLLRIGLGGRPGPMPSAVRDATFQFLNYAPKHMR